MRVGVRLAASSANKDRGLLSKSDEAEIAEDEDGAADAPGVSC